MRRVAIVALALVAAAWAGPDQEVARAVKKAISNLKSREPGTRRLGAQQLAALGSAAQKAVPHLAKALGDEDNGVRWDASVALRQIGEDAVPKLVKALKSRNSTTRLGICNVLLRKELIDAVPVHAKALTLALKDPDPWVRTSGIALFVAIGASGIDALLSVLKVSDASAREAAVQALVRVSGEAVTLLGERLDKGKNHHLREGICVVIGRLGRKAADAGPSLARALRDPDEGVRAEAARALGRTGAVYEDVAPALFEGFASESERMREGCIDGLAAYGAPAAPLLVKSVDASDGVVRRSARETLFRMGGPAIRPLLEALTEGTPARRRAAIDLLVRFGVRAPLDETLRGLRECLEFEDAGVRETAAAALGHLGRNQAVERKPERPVPTITSLIAAAGDENAAVRAAALTSLGQLGSSKARETIEKGSKDPDPRVKIASHFGTWGIGGDPGAALAALCAGLKDPASRAAAADGLGRMGIAAEAALPKLMEVLKDENPEARRAAAHAFGRIVRPGRAGVRAVRGSWRKKAPAPVKKAIEKGLGWLRANQAADGLWDSDEHGGGALYDPGVTGLALWALVGAGETDTETVRRGLDYLLAIQAVDGVIGFRASHSFASCHATAGLALAEAWLLTGNPRYLRAVEAAVGFAEAARNPDLAWRYEPRGGENDTHMTAWMLTLLRLADLGGVPVEQTAYAGAERWIDKMTDLHFGQIGYNYPGGAPARPEGKQDFYPPENSQAMTAAGAWCRQLLGGRLLAAKVQPECIKLCMEILPRWQRKYLDFYYFHFGSLAMFQDGSAWKEWAPALSKTFVPEQDDNGSWRPIGVWGEDGGRVYSTSMAVLSLLVPYRYPRRFASHPKLSSVERQVIQSLKRASKDSDPAVSAAATDALHRVQPRG